MSTTGNAPLRRRRLLIIGVAVVLVCAVIALPALWISEEDSGVFADKMAFLAFWKEDPRVTSDKEGRNLPGLYLRLLAHAMHQYHEKHGRLPPAAVYSKDGEPLLSWRVLLLPYLEEDELFRQFKLDEPWDSPHNRRLLPKMPQVFSPLEGSPPLAPYTTLFQVFVGKGTAFEGREGWRFKEDIPRRSYTILIVEAGKSVPWTKPEDIAYDEDQPLPKLGGFFKGRFHVAMADGMSVSVRQDAVPATFRSAMLRNGDGTWPWGER